MRVLTMLPALAMLAACAPPNQTAGGFAQPGYPAQAGFAQPQYAVPQQGFAQPGFAAQPGYPPAYPAPPPRVTATPAPSGITAGQGGADQTFGNTGFGGITFVK